MTGIILLDSDPSIIKGELGGFEFRECAKIGLDQIFSRNLKKGNFI